MTRQTKTQWAQSLQEGDVVMTRFRCPLREKWQSATVELVNLDPTAQSGTTVKLKELPYSIDIFWIEPTPNTVVMPGN